MMTDNGIEYDAIANIEEPIPCGVGVTTIYTLGGVEVRKDFSVHVDYETAVRAGLISQGSADITGQVA